MAIRRLLDNTYRTAVIGAVQLAVVAGAAAVTAHADTGQLTTWCNLQLGQTKDEVLAAMGTPNGNRADSVAELWTDMDPNSTSVEWDTSGAILLAGFNRHDSTVHLLAYDAKYGVGPIGAKGISCEPFRNDNS
ncbi:hypothetical protein [Nocardia sp. NPDC056100]|uniref:hypothetical protein n=1 Tax=Nocardia sp. NPDC056100 TaxID=3345712 RepID=UPI0035D670F9